MQPSTHLNPSNLVRNHTRATSRTCAVILLAMTSLFSTASHALNASNVVREWHTAQTTQGVVSFDDGWQFSFRHGGQNRDHSKRRPTHPAATSALPSAIDRLLHRRGGVILSAQYKQTHRGGLYLIQGIDQRGRDYRVRVDAITGRKIGKKHRRHQNRHGWLR